MKLARIAPSRPVVGDVDPSRVAYDFVVKSGSSFIHPPRQDEGTPGCAPVLFEDRDGIRLEVNFVPGRRCLEASGS